MASYVMQNSSYGYASNIQYEPFLTVNTLANPFAFHNQKMEAIGQAYNYIHGHPPLPPQIMKTNDMDPRGQQLAANRHNYEDERLTDEQMKTAGDLIWKGLKGMSRFYANEGVPVGGAMQSNGSRFQDRRISLGGDSDFQPAQQRYNGRVVQRSSSQGRQSMIGNSYFNMRNSNAFDYE